MTKRSQKDTREAARRAQQDEPSSRARVGWLIGMIAWVVAAAAAFSFDPADPPSHALAGAAADAARPISNWIGQVGAFGSYHAFLMLGEAGAWTILLGVLVGMIHVAWRGPLTWPGVRAVGLVMIALAVSCFHALLFPNWTAMPEGAGGLLGIAGAGVLTERFGGLGAGLIIFVGLVIGTWVAAEQLLIIIPRALGLVAGKTAGSAARAAARAKQARAAIASRQDDVSDDRKLAAVGKLLGAAAKKRKAKDEEQDDDEYEYEDEYEDDDEAWEEDDEAPDDAEDDDEWEEVDEDDDEWEYEDEEEDDADAEVVAEHDDDHPADQPLDKDALRQKIAKLPVRFASSSKLTATQEDLDALRAARLSEEEIDRTYQFPPLDILAEPEENFSEELERWVRNQAEHLEQAMHTYGIKGSVVGIDSGPVITLFRVRLAPGTKVAQLTPIASDIARMLKAINIRIVPNEEGQDTVGVEVPNRRKEKVRLKELMTNSKAAQSMRLPMFLGKDASGNPLVIDLASLPHMLIAGTTGSGKSVCMNAIIMGFLYTMKPSDLKLILVDPKMVELSQFKDIPHLLCPVVTDMGKAAAILEWAVGKMDERYELLAEAGCRDIAAYNELSWEEKKERLNPKTELEEARIPRKLPYIVFVIDELADLIMTHKDVESSIVRIAQKARAVGIHLILATQRPQANVVTGLIKSNMPGRLSFRVASGMDSRIVLDQKGGELLLGHGDMLMLTPRSSVPIRAQGTLVDDAEARKAVRFIREVSAPSFEHSLATITNHGFGEAGGSPLVDDYEERMRRSAQEDPLFDRAVEIVLETRRGSVSLLQRRLAIGYTRASRLIELMGQAGIIGSHKGSVAREVIMTLEEWQAMKQIAESDASTAVEDQGNDDQAAEAFEADDFSHEALHNAPAEEDDRADARALAHTEVKPALAPPVEIETRAPIAPTPVLALTAAEPNDDLIDEATAPADEDDEDLDTVAEAAADESEEEEDEEYEYVDEDEDAEAEDEEELDEDEEYVYVDEDGNELTPEEVAAMDEEEWEYVDEDEDEEAETEDEYEEEDEYDDDEEDAEEAPPIKVTTRAKSGKPEKPGKRASA
ncbi:MAG: DNA translocase FtsK 4TM domain-containing protein [Phycisphaerales bacterium]|nr:DNA translocase FtsK 4TM domain-containing protein [Phycisphaerales bacterium]